MVLLDSAAGAPGRMDRLRDVKVSCLANLEVGMYAAGRFIASACVDQRLPIECM